MRMFSESVGTQGWPLAGNVEVSSGQGTDSRGGLWEKRCR